MKPTPNGDLNSFHELAKAKQFHDDDELINGEPTPRQMLAWLALITSEWDEAGLETELYYYSNEKPGKPEGGLVECVDGYIRCLDAQGACKCVPYVAELHNPSEYEFARARLAACEAARDGHVAEFVAHLSEMAAWFEWCVVEQTSPERFVEICNEKHAYNMTRPPKHGRKA